MKKLDKLYLDLRIYTYHLHSPQFFSHSSCDFHMNVAEICPFPFCFGSHGGEMNFVQGPLGGDQLNPEAFNPSQGSAYFEIFLQLPVKIRKKNVEKY